MTPKQVDYVRHRVAGLGQEQAAKAAGYAASSSKVIASRMEKLPAIRAAIDEARHAKQGSASVGLTEFDDAHAYLTAVVQGLTPPDPVRVGAARALLPFERAKQRAPIKSATSAELARREIHDVERVVLDEWAIKSAKVRDQIKKTK